MNSAVIQGEFDMDQFSKGLVHVITTDLMAATPLTIVDRQRLDVLTRESELNSNELAMDPDFRVRLGKLTGAQSYIFGTLMQVKEEELRLDLRWVQTATTEVLLSEGVTVRLRSADDLFKLEREVLLDLLVPSIHKLLAGSEETNCLEKKAKRLLKDKEKHVPGKTAYVDLLLKTGEAILAEERGDLAAAAQAWRETQAINPDDTYASGRTRTLDAHLALTKE
jgi:hypothetical protein